MCENEGEGGGVLVTTTFSTVHTSATVEVQIKANGKRYIFNALYWLLVSTRFSKKAAAHTFRIANLKISLILVIQEKHSSISIQKRDLSRLFV